MLILVSTWAVLKDSVKKICLIRNVFTATGDNGKKLGGHTGDEDYLPCKMNLE